MHDSDALHPASSDKPAHAVRVRTAAEWVLRVAAVGVLAWCLVAALRQDAHNSHEQAMSAGLHDALVRWSTVVRPGDVHVAFDRVPRGVERDWLGALPGAGTTVGWSSSSLPATAVSMEPRADPAGGADVSIAAPARAAVTLRDTLGLLAELHVGSALAADVDTSTRDAPTPSSAVTRVFVPRPQATVDAAVDAAVARAAVLDSLSLRLLLVIGAAGWETKFVTAALEERGWDVDAHVVVSPQTMVRQGVTGALASAIDTARYSAVLVLDTTAARHAQRIAQYVRAGGGLVLWSPAAHAPPLRALAAGAAGVLIESDGTPPSDTLPRHALSLMPITAPADDAIVLERVGDHVTLAARRIGAGRVIQNGYLDSWRWRMAGGDDAPERHRAWLAAVVARVAYAPRSELAPPSTDAAPVATLVDRLGSATPAREAGFSPASMALGWWAFGLLCGALLLEWTSRRTRGVK